jgi:chaperonin GroES
MVSALRLVVPEGARDLSRRLGLPRKSPTFIPHEIACKQREGYYLDVDLGTPEDDKGRLLLEQHLWTDLDEDGYDEPYIVTVDKEQRQVLRVEANFSETDIEWNGDVPIRIEPGRFFVKYGFFPHPEGKFYDIGLGHLLKHVGAAIDTCLNQLLDAGNARVAGAGSSVPGSALQGRGRIAVVRFRPAEYKTVDDRGRHPQGHRRADLPDVSPITFQVLEFIMGFGREIAGTKDILTGNSPATAPVGNRAGDDRAGPSGLQRDRQALLPLRP